MAHECPRCGSCCHCGGDMDDVVVHDVTDCVHCEQSWKTEQSECERCGHKQISVHPDCERIECSICGFMMQSVPANRDEND